MSDSRPTERLPDLDLLEALGARATARPWHDTGYHEDAQGPHIEDGKERTVAVCALRGGGTRDDLDAEGRANGQFVAAACNGALPLAREVKRLRQELLQLHASETDDTLDGTDLAHPAWWRGRNSGADVAEKLLEELRAEVAALKARASSSSAGGWRARPPAATEFVLGDEHPVPWVHRAPDGTLTLYGLWVLPHDPRVHTAVTVDGRDRPMCVEDLPWLTEGEWCPFLPGAAPPQAPPPEGETPQEELIEQLQTQLLKARKEARHLDALIERDPPRAIEALLARCSVAERTLAAQAKELARHRKDLQEAAGELVIDFPAPGSVEAKLLRANVLLRAERDEALGRVTAQKKASKTPPRWLERRPKEAELEIHHRAHAVGPRYHNVSYWLVRDWDNYLHLQEVVYEREELQPPRWPDGRTWRPVTISGGRCACLGDI